MRYLILGAFVFLSGCSALNSSECGIQDCDRPVSTQTHLVIWWAKGMRGNLNLDQDTTIYALTPE